MKSIKLTEEQKDKLLEMCNTLFPEYDFSMFHNGLNNDLDEFIIDINHLNNTHYLSIHWFEFCMTHLAEKIFNQIDDEDDIEYRQEFQNTCLISKDQHPIDYLYSEFLKLSK